MTEFWGNAIILNSMLAGSMPIRGKPDGCKVKEKKEYKNKKE